MWYGEASGGAPNQDRRIELRGDNLSVSFVNENANGSRESRQPKTPVQQLWKDCKVTVKKNVSIENFSLNERNIQKIQFLLINGIFETKFKDDLFGYGIVIDSIDVEHIYLTDQKNDTKTFEHIKGRFIDILHQYSTVEKRVSCQFIRQKLHDVNPELLKDVAILDDGVGTFLILAPNENSLNHMLRVVGLTVEKIPIQGHEYASLKVLGFDDYLANLFHGACDLFLAEDTCILTWLGRPHGRADGRSLISNFFNSAKADKLQVETELAEQLLFDIKSGIPNEAFTAFILLQTNDPKGTALTFRRKKNDIYVVWVGEVTCDLKQIVERSITYWQLPHETILSTDMSKYLNNWEEKRKIVRNKKDGNMVCTSDRVDDLHTLAQGHMQFGLKQQKRLSKMWIQFLNTYGKPLLVDSQSRSVEMELKKKSLYISASEVVSLMSGLEEFKAKSKSCMQSVPVYLNESTLKSHEEKIEEAMKMNQCCWSVQKKDLAIPKSKVSAEYFAKWRDNVNDFTISVLEMTDEVMKCDTFIEFVTQNLFPLSEVMLSEEYLMLEKSSAGKTKLKVGEIVTYEEKGTTGHIKFKEIHGICAIEQKPEISEQSIITKEQLTQSFIKVMETSKKTQIVCISAQTVQEELPLCDIVGATVSGMIQFAESTDVCQGTNIVVCCIDNQQCKEAADVIDSYFEKRGGCQKISSWEVLTATIRPQKVLLTVTEGDLGDAVADVLVNTCNRKLDFKHGYISTLFASKCGSAMVNECEEKYPNGLQFGMVGYTRAYDMEQKNIRYIFHAALQKFENEKFRQNVKLYLKNCLYLADRLHCKSLALPAIGVGNLKYPWRETIVAIYEAVDEFNNEAFNHHIQNVTVLVFDEETKRIFLGEQNRRTQKDRSFAPQMPDIQGREEIVLDICTNKRSLKVRVMSKESFGAPPSHMVELKILEKKGPNVEFKPAAQEPLTWNDEIHISKKYFERKFSSDLCKELKKERVTDVLLQIADDNKDIESQITFMTGAFRDATISSDSVWYWNSLVILVPFAKLSVFRNLKVYPNSEWKQQTFEQEPGMTIKLIGKDEDCGIKAKQDVMKILDTAQQQSREAVSEPVPVTKSIDDQQKTGFSEMDFRVSAVINKGIIKYLGTVDRLDIWKKDAAKYFSVEFEKQGEDEFSVHGTFEKICKLEDYLTNEFPNSPGSNDLHVDEEYFSSDKVIKCSSIKYVMLLRCDDDLGGQVKYNPGRGEIEITASKAMGRKVEELLRNNHIDLLFFDGESLAENALKSERVENVKYNKNGKYITLTSTDKDALKSAFQKLLPSQEIAKYKVKNNLVIRLVLGDLRNADAECLVVSAPAKLTQSKGAAKCVADMLGESYVEECKNCVAGKKELKNGECRLIKSGLDFRQWIAHVCIQSNHCKSTNSYLEKCIRCCLDEAEKTECRSIAMTCLQVDVFPGGVVKWAQEYIKAITSGKFSFLKEVVIIDTKEYKLRKIGDLLSMQREIPPGQNIFYIQKTVVEVYIGSLHNEVVDALVCQINKNCKPYGQLSQNVHELGDTVFKKAFQSKQNSGHWKEVFAVPGSSEMAGVKLVFHIPCYQSMIKDSLKRVVEIASEKKVESMAISFSVMEEKTGGMPCTCFVDGLVDALKQTTTIKKILVMSETMDAATGLTECLMTKDLGRETAL